MRTYSVLCLLAALGSTLGCGRSGPPIPPPQQAEVESPKSSLSLLLNEPREKLAQMGDDVLKEIETRVSQRQQGKLKFALLPDWQHPLVLPVSNALRYQVALDQSLPSYVDPKKAHEDKKLAEQLSWFGDREAGKKLAGTEIPGEPYGKNYPIEWSRLVALKSYSLQQRVAMGDPSGPTELAEWHREIKEILDPKAKDAPLGQYLQSQGGYTLRLALAAWKKRNNSSLVSGSEAALEELSATKPPRVLRGTKAEWAETLGVQSDGSSLFCRNPQRAIDLLGLPFTSAMAEVVILVFSREDQLDEVQVFYTSRLSREFRNSPDLASNLSNWLEPSQSESTLTTHQVEGGTVETVLCPVGGNVGGWVRWSRNRKPESVQVVRKLGDVGLDHNLEANRLRITPTKLVVPIKLVDKKELTALANPLPAGKLRGFQLQPVAGQNLVAEATWQFGSEAPIHQLAEPIIDLLGVGEMKLEIPSAKSNEPPRVVLRWQDERTECVLLSPLEAQRPTELTLRDRRDASKSAQRLTEVNQQQTVERSARLEANKPQRVLARRLEHLSLGLTREQFLRSLPVGKSGVVSRELPDRGVLLAFLGPPPAKQPYTIRQFLARFNAQQELHWLQIRYETGDPQAAKSVDWTKSLLSGFEKQGGLVAGRSAYKSIFGDLPQSATMVYSWHDDVTELTCLADRGVFEATLVDRPPSGTKVEQLTYLPRGPRETPADLALGTNWSDVLSKLQNLPMAEGPEGSYMIASDKGLVDRLLVWQLDGKVTRILARIRETHSSNTPSEMEAQLRKLWQNDVRTVGWPKRMDLAPEGVLQGLTWIDDQTRYRIFWTGGDSDVPRLWQEWIQATGDALGR